LNTGLKFGLKEKIKKRQIEVTNKTSNKIKKKSRLLVMIIIVYFVFFLVEISTGFYTHSLALIADAFHMLSDLFAFIISLTALRLSEKKVSPKTLTFGWKRAQDLGAFFNGVFLLALALSTLLQSIERFISLQHLENIEIVLAVGCAGLTMNIVSILFLHG
ncbi:Cobalt uptake protein COT1, partial [Erysiphe necator]